MASEDATRILEFGRGGRSRNAAVALRELNNPEDVAPIEQALLEAGLE